MLLGNHDFYEGNLKTTGKQVNCVLSFNVQESVLIVYTVENSIFLSDKGILFRLVYGGHF